MLHEACGVWAHWKRYPPQSGLDLKFSHRTMRMFCTAPASSTEPLAVIWVGRRKVLTPSSLISNRERKWDVLLSSFNSFDSEPCLEVDRVCCLGEIISNLRVDILDGGASLLAQIRVNRSTVIVFRGEVKDGLQMGNPYPIW